MRRAGAASYRNGIRLVLWTGFWHGGLGSVLLGWLTDVKDVAFTIELCSFLPLLGLCAFLLPKDSKLMRKTM